MERSARLGIEVRRSLGNELSTSDLEDYYTVELDRAVELTFGQQGFCFAFASIQVRTTTSYYQKEKLESSATIYWQASLCARIKYDSLFAADRSSIRTGQVENLSKTQITVLELRTNLPNVRHCNLK